MNRRAVVPPVLILALAAPGCLTGTLTHEILVQPDGSAVWAIEESRVRSDEKDPAEREREEIEYRDLLLGGDSAGAGIFSELGVAGPRVRVVRDEVPFAARTEARFEGLDQAIRAMYAKKEAAPDVVLEAGPAGGSLVVRFPSDAEGLRLVTCEQMEGCELRIVLVRGRFVAAQGFRLEQEAREAVLDEVVPVDPADGRPVYRLAWEGAPAP